MVCVGEQSGGDDSHEGESHPPDIRGEEIVDTPGLAVNLTMTASTDPLSVPTGLLLSVGWSLKISGLHAQRATGFARCTDN